MNKLCLWTNEDRLDENGETLPRSGDELEVEPRLLCEVDHMGDVTDLLVKRFLLYLYMYIFSVQVCMQFCCNTCLMQSL